MDFTLPLMGTITGTQKKDAVIPISPLSVGAGSLVGEFTDESCPPCIPLVNVVHKCVPQFELNNQLAGFRQYHLSVSPCSPISPSIGVEVQDPCG